jgi:hypothetical protein
LSKSVPKDNFGDFFENISKIFFGYFSGFLGAQNRALQHP